MKEHEKSAQIKSLISGIYLLLAVCLVLGVCGYCYPQIGQKARQIISGSDNGAVQEAFGVLADGLLEKKPVKEVLSQSYEALKGEEN